MKDKKRFLTLLCSVFFVLVHFTHPISAIAIEFGYPNLAGSVEYISSADVDETNPQAKVSITFARIGAAVPVNLTENSNLEVNLSGGHFHFDWNDKELLKFSNGEEPWNDLNLAEFGLTYVYKWNKKWASLLGSGIGAGWEKDTDDIFSYRGFLGTSYRWGQRLNWQASLGVGFGRGPEKTSGGFFRGPYGTTLGPFGSISWNEEQRKLFKPGWSFYFKLPLDVEVAYVFNERWAVHYNWGDFGAIFRLADDNDVSPEGLLAASYTKMGLAVDFRPIETLTLSLGFSEYFHKKFDIQDNDGNSLQIVDIRDSFGVRFSVIWAF